MVFVFIGGVGSIVLERVDNCWTAESKKKLKRHAEFTKVGSHSGKIAVCRYVLLFLFFRLAGVRGSFVMDGFSGSCGLKIPRSLLACSVSMLGICQLCSAGISCILCACGSSCIGGSIVVWWCGIPGKVSRLESAMLRMAWFPG
jgi:hypothetical protein